MVVPKEKEEELNFIYKPPGPKHVPIEPNTKQMVQGKRRTKALGYRKGKELFDN